MNTWLWDREANLRTCYLVLSYLIYCTMILFALVSHGKELFDLVVNMWLLSADYEVFADSGCSLGLELLLDYYM